MTDIARYQVGWERYWHETLQLSAASPEEARSIWEADWNDAAKADLPRLKEWLTSQLPLIDFGCGNGRQTAYLAEHFPRIIGTDVSASAIAMAQRQYGAANISYRVLDAFEVSAVNRLHRELGDANIYMRTVLHQIALEERPRFVNSLKTLLGKTGTLYLYELSSASDTYIHDFIAKYGVPDKLQRILCTGMSPGPVGRADVNALFEPEFSIVNDGSHVAGAFKFPLGAQGELVEFAPPTYFAIVRPRAAEA